MRRLLAWLRGLLWPRRRSPKGPVRAPPLPLADGWRYRLIRGLWVLRHPQLGELLTEVALECSRPGLVVTVPLTSGGWRYGAGRLN